MTLTAVSRRFRLLDPLLCEGLDRCWPMELLRSRIAEVDPAGVEALHHLDVETGSVGGHPNAFQNALPGRLGQLYGLELTPERLAVRGFCLVGICFSFVAAAS